MSVISNSPAKIRAALLNVSVGARLAGEGALKDAFAGKPGSYTGIGGYALLLEALS
jgi:hypothetical protein